MGLYDALFRRGLPTRLQAMRAARDQAAPGLGALRAGLEASGRWCLANGPIAQVMFWRPVPRFEPTFPGGPGASHPCYRN